MNPLLAQEQSLIRAGHQSFYGSFAQQNPSAFLSINRLLNAHNFDTIIEIGSHDFGLSTQLALYCALSRMPAACENTNEPVLYKNKTHHKSPKTFWTFDYVLRDQNAALMVQHLGGHFRQADVLTNETNINSIRELIRGGGATLLLCDGGNKKKELELYGSVLKSGDFVMLHDWAYDEATFEHNKRAGIWFSHETKWEDGVGEGQQFGIRSLCEQYGIEPIYADEFDKVAWFCGRKT
jgi:hypothetical protein